MHTYYEIADHRIVGLKPGWTKTPWIEFKIWTRRLSFGSCSEFVTGPNAPRDDFHGLVILPGEIQNVSLRGGEKLFVRFIVPTERKATTEEKVDE